MTARIGTRSAQVKRGVLTVAIVGAVLLAFTVPFSTLGTANLALTYTLVAISLVILTGWVGQISLAQAAFVGLGAYTTGLVVRSLELLFPVTILVGAVVAAVSAALLGIVALRVRGLYLAVATLIFAWMAQGYLFNLPWLAGIGGSSVAATPPLGQEGGWPFLDFTERRTFYFIALAAVGAAILTAANLRDSKMGRAWFAVKGSEVAAASLGIDVTRAKLAAFAVSGFLAGLAGGLTMTHAGVASASSFTVERSLFFLSIAVVGGLTSLGGALASGLLFASLEEVFFRVEALAGALLIVSAGLLAAVLLFFPAGLAGIPARLTPVTRRLAGAGAAIRQQLRGAPTTGAIEPEGATTDNGGDEDEDEDEDDAETGTEGKALVVEDAEAPPPTGIRAGVDRLNRWLSRYLLGAHRDAPDALLASIEEAEALEQQEHQTLAPSRLSYVPGTATKIELAPRGQLEVLLRASDITVQFGGLTAVNSFDLEVRRGEIVALIGPNGAGKTTLFNAVSGLNEPTSGHVELFGDDVTNLPVHVRAGYGVGRTFQVLQLFPDLTVFENLMVATHMRNPTGFFANMSASQISVAWEASSRSRVRQVIELANLDDVADRRASDLPFGVLRLVELARAIVTGAPLVMLDEPASGLDNAETDRFMDFLLWARQTLGITMLLIEHDLRVVMGLADYVYVIDRGNQIAHGTPANVQRDEAVIAAYLGSASSAKSDDAPTTADEPPPPDGKDTSTRRRTSGSGATKNRAKSSTRTRATGAKTPARRR